LGKDQSEFARLGHVTPASLSQIMGLFSLAPDIQEAILFLPRVDEGRDRVTELDVRRVTGSLDSGFGLGGGISGMVSPPECGEPRKTGEKSFFRGGCAQIA